MRFEPYPFEKLTTLLSTIAPNTGYTPIDLTIGEPQFATPSFIQQALCAHAGLLNRYPKSAGETYLREAMRGFVARRFAVRLEESQLIPTFGTRELLFNFPQFWLHEIPNPRMAYTNPFYQIYEGAALASRASVLHLTLDEEGAAPIPSDEELDALHLVILNYPNNPTGATLELSALSHWVELALKHDFVLLNDECYSEIYAAAPPPSLLEASLAVGNDSFKNILVANSLSKRSSAPGVRSGFIAGDAEILEAYQRYRTYLGCAIPLPLQQAAAAAWQDDTHAATIRAQYVANLALAGEILEIPVPEATFYLWLLVRGPIAFTQQLWRDYHVKVLPGSYLGRGGAGNNHVRIALVHGAEITQEALERIQQCRRDLREVV